MHVCMYVCMYVCMCEYVCVCMCIYIYIYTYIHIHVIKDSDYQYYMGTLFLVGPELNQDRTCDAGLPCTLSAFSGQSLSTSDRIALVESGGECGTHDRDPLIASNAYKQLSASITIDLTAADLPIGGTWRICYCTALYGGCDDFSDFLLEAGLLTVRGPDDQHQDRACSAGLACTLGPFTGQGLSTLDRISLIPVSGTCGADARDASVVDDAYLSVDAYRQVGILGVSLPYGDQWMMCYCTDVGGCDADAEFSVEIGILTVRGPNPLTQDRTCTAGVNCTITGFTGQWLSTSDMISMIHPDGDCVFNDKDPLIMQDQYKPVEVLANSECMDAWSQDCQTQVKFVGVGESRTTHRVEARTYRIIHLSPSLSLSIYIYIYIYTHTHCMCISLSLYSIHLSLSLYIYIYTYTCIYVCVYIYIYIHYIYIYIYIYTYMEGLFLETNNALDGDLPKGGRWKICYCAGYDNCLDRNAFSVQVGVL